MSSWASVTRVATVNARIAVYEHRFAVGVVEGDRVGRLGRVERLAEIDVPADQPARPPQRRRLVDLLALLLQVSRTRGQLLLEIPVGQVRDRDGVLELQASERLDPRRDRRDPCIPVRWIAG